MKLMKDSARTAALDVRTSHWNIEGRVPFPVDPFVIAEKLGIVVDEVGLPLAIAGFILKRSGGPVEVFLNDRGNTQWRRFALAHIIGHYVRDEDSEEIGYVDNRSDLMARVVDPEEIWCNRFATELLMPSGILRKWWLRGDSPEQVRNKFDVSKQRLATRLGEMGLLRE